MQDKALRSCKAASLKSCGGLSEAKVDKLRGNPAGTSKPDKANEALRDNITVNDDGSIDISIKYTSQGDSKRVKEAIKDIRREWRRGDVNVDFTRVDSADDADLVIFGASPEDMVRACLVQSCEASIGVGGWAPFTGKLLGLNSVSSGDWSDTAAHEFGHKLGLRHRNDGGIMDYKSKKNPNSGTKILTSDVDRLRSLYE